MFSMLDLTYNLIKNILGFGKSSEKKSFKEYI